MSAHAKLSPSSAHRWINCPGSVEACKDIKQEFNEAAELGSGAHGLAEKTLGEARKEVDPAWIGQRFSFMYDGKRTSVEVTLEMVEHINIYITRILEMMKKLRAENPRVKLFLEKTLRLDFVRKGMFGHSDGVLDTQNTILVSDFKYGYVPVYLVGRMTEYRTLNYDEAEINPQLLCYAAGALQEALWLPETVILEIVQPRSMEVPEVQSCELPSDWVYEWVNKTLRPAADAADDPEAPRIAGEWCRFCPAASTCPALADEMERLANIDFDRHNAPTPVAQLSDEKLVRILQWTPVLDAWLREVNAFAFDKLMRGEKLPGYKLVRGRGSRHWPTDSYLEMVEMLATEFFFGLKIDPLMPKDDVAKAFIAKVTEPIQLKSPKQIEDLGADFKDVVEKLAIKKLGSLTLAVESDRRKAVQHYDDFEGFGITN